MSVHRRALTWGLNHFVEVHKAYRRMGSSFPIRGSWLGNTIAVATGTCLCGRLPIREHFGEYDVLQ